MPEPDQPTPRRVAGVLGLLFAGQVLAMLLIVAGGVWLMITVAHNNSLDCSTVGFGATSSCGHRSYAAPIALLAGGFALFLVGMVLSASYGLRHVGGPLLGLLRRRAEEDVESRTRPT